MSDCFSLTLGDPRRRKGSDSHEHSSVQFVICYKLVDTFKITDSTHTVFKHGNPQVVTLEIIGMGNSALIEEVSSLETVPCKTTGRDFAL